MIINFKKFLFFSFVILLVAVFFVSGNEVFANQKNQENYKHFFYYFYRPDCSFCAKVEENFFPGLKERNPKLEIKKINPTTSLENREFFLKIATENFGLDSLNIGVPAIFIGNYYVIGLPGLREEEKIERIIQDCLVDGCPSPQDVIPQQTQNIRKLDYLTLPVVGEINVVDYSFPVLTIMIAAADGFNPCALWILTFLILLVLKEPSRKRLTLIVGTFILVYGLFYFLILAAWLHVFLIIGYLRIIQVIIGLVALGMGIWQIKSFFENKPNVCKINQKENNIRNTIIEKAKKLINQKNIFLTIIGVSILSIFFSFFGFLCSAGFPAVWSSLLALQEFTPIYNYFFVFLYTIVFMIDEIVIFTIAFITLKFTKFSGKITKWVVLIGGLLMIILGLAILFKPEWLVFI